VSLGSIEGDATTGAAAGTVEASANLVLCRAGGVGFGDEGTSEGGLARLGVVLSLAAVGEAGEILEVAAVGLLGGMGIFWDLEAGLSGFFGDCGSVEEEEDCAASPVGVTGVGVGVGEGEEEEEEEEEGEDVSFIGSIMLGFLRSLSGFFAGSSFWDSFGLATSAVATAVSGLLTSSCFLFATTGALAVAARSTLGADAATPTLFCVVVVPLCIDFPSVGPGAGTNAALPLAEALRGKGLD